MASECDNEETADIVETEAADSDDKTKKLKLCLAFLSLFPTIMLFPLYGSFLGVQAYGPRDDPIC